MDRKYQHLEKRLTPQDAHYFFGYFDKCPWNAAGDHPVHRVGFAGKHPRFGDRAEIGVMRNGRFEKTAETFAWCWQQGAMLEFFDEERLIWNDIEGDHFVARLSDGSTLPRAVYTLSADRKHALSLNFSRLDAERPGYGYPGGADPSAQHAFPDNDGIFLMDTATKECRLIISLRQLADGFYAPGADANMNWVNHLTISPDGKRIAFLHRFRCFGPWGRGVKSYVTRMFTADIGGQNLRQLPVDFHASHYTWKNNDELIVYSRLPAGGDQYRIYRVGENSPRIFARDRLPANGHCSFSPDGRLLLTDSYTEPDGCRELVVYDEEKDARYSLGRYHSPDILQCTRCDLHPRWSRDGRRVSFDSFHEKYRGTYVIDLPEEILC
ncbi:MAG: PD40 domain-containing protein [Lentisphaeria bacterium]|nr:PD40 domain-containing protein [Lentisphaeria bacterium]